MLIQNVTNTTQAPPARLASDGAPSVAVNAYSSVDSPPAVAVESAPTTTKPPEVAQQPTPTELKQAMESFNKALKQANKNLEFSVDSDTHKVLVKLVDTETGDVIREYPSEEALAIARSIDRFQQGLLLKQQA